MHEAVRRRTRWSIVAKALVLLVLIGTGLGGLYNAPNEWPDAVTTLQHLTSAGELSYGVSGMLTAWAVIRTRRWARIPGAVWVASITAVATLAPIAYGGDEVPLGSALAGGFAALVVALLVWRAVLTITTREG